MAEKEHCKLSQHGVALLDKIEHLRARSLLAKDTSSPISIGSADCNLNCACSVELEHNYPANTRIRIVRLGKLNTKGLEGSGLLTIVCVVAEKTPDSFGQGSGPASGDLPASTGWDVFVRVRSNPQGEAQHLFCDAHFGNHFSSLPS
jgi:hypothetical protein